MPSRIRDDQFPLLLVVNSGDDMFDKSPPLPVVQSDCDRNVTLGAATVLSRWPQHVTMTSRLALITALTMMSLSLLTVALIMYTSDTSMSTRPFDGGARTRTKMRRHGLCDTERRHVLDMYDVADVDALVKYMSPLQTAMEFLYDHRKLFFVVNEGDMMTARKRCAIASAARTNPKVVIYLLIFVQHPHVEGLVKSESINLTEVGKNVRVIHVKARDYFKLTPLGSFWEREVSDKAMKELAEKLVTLWRFGGLALDFNVISLSKVVQPQTRCKNASMDVTGRILGVRQPCHEFMFQAMMVLARLQRETPRKGSKQITDAKTVLEMTRDIFCKVPHCKDAEAKWKCPSVDVMPDSDVCRGEYPDKKECVWLVYAEVEENNAVVLDTCSRFVNLS